MSKLIICRGLPASGKTSWAQEYVQESFQNNIMNVMNVDRDSIRLLNGFDLIAGQYEHTVSMIRDGMIRQGLKNGFTVIESSTNLKAAYVKDLAKIAAFFGAEVEVKDFDTALEECIRRDMLRGLCDDPGISVGEDVIRSYYDRYFKNGQFPPNPLENVEAVTFEPYIRDVNKRSVYLVDLDGTLCKMNGRSSYDYTRVNEDLPHYDVIDLVTNLYELGYNIIFVSGREDSCWSDTVDWLADYVGIMTSPGIDLFMRKTGDKRQDAIIKYEIFKKYIEPNYNVLGVFDDRSQIVEMYRKIGVRVYQVAEGNF